MFQPNTKQWRVIWVAVVVEFFALWLWAMNTDIPGYRADSGFFGALAVFVVVCGGLIVWWLEGKKGKP